MNVGVAYIQVRCNVGKFCKSIFVNVRCEERDRWQNLQSVGFDVACQMMSLFVFIVGKTFHFFFFCSTNLLCIMCLSSSPQHGKNGIFCISWSHKDSKRIATCSGDGFWQVLNVSLFLKFVKAFFYSCGCETNCLTSLLSLW